MNRKTAHQIHRRRKRRCDETKPSCLRCIQSYPPLPCGGYPPFTTEERTHDDSEQSSFEYVVVTTSETFSSSCGVMQSPRARKKVDIFRKPLRRRWNEMHVTTRSSIKASTAYTVHRISPAIVLEKARIFLFQCPASRFSTCDAQLSFRLPPGHYTVPEIYTAAFITWHIHLRSSHSAEGRLSYLADRLEKDTRNETEEKEVLSVRFSFISMYSILTCEAARSKVLGRCKGHSLLSRSNCCCMDYQQHVRSAIVNGNRRFCYWHRIPNTFNWRKPAVSV